MKPSKHFEKSFREATTEFVAIPTDDMQFSELSRIAESANKMIDVQKKTEKSLQESEALLRGIFDNMGTGVAIYETPDEGQSFVFKELNRHGLESGHLKREDVIGRGDQRCFPRGIGAWPVQGLSKCLENWPVPAASQQDLPR